MQFFFNFALEMLFISLLGEGAKKRSNIKLTSVSFMYVCVAENAELLVFFYFIFCTFPIGNFLSEGRF